MVELTVQSLATEMGTGAVLGFISGYAAKMVTKIVAVVAGLGILMAKWLESQGFVSIDWSGVSGGFLDVGSAAAESAPSLVDSFVSTLGLGGGFAAGFYLGFRRG